MGPLRVLPVKSQGKNKKADASSETPRPDSDDLPNQTADRKSVEEEEREPEAKLLDVDYRKLTQNLDVAKESIFAADCCIALLGSDRLTKQVGLNFWNYLAARTLMEI